MGNIKIRNLTAATSADITSGNMVPVALDEDAGLERVTRRATFSQIVSGGSGVLAADPNSPFVFNNTTAEQVFKGGLSVPGNITLSGNLNLTGAISGNATGYFDELYISGSAGGWHQITTGWSGSEGGGGGKWIDGAGGDIYYNGGDVGIGTTNPSKKLEIQADAGANTYPFFIKGSNVDQNRIGGIFDVHHGTSSIGVLCAFRNDTETEVFLTASGSSYLLGGDFGIGTQTPSARLHVTGGDGTVLAGSGVFTEALTISGVPVSTGNGDGEPAFVSDVRLKDDTRPIEEPTKKISQLQGVNFIWNDKSPVIAPDTPDVGVIAQDVQGIMPEAIKTNPDGYLSVYYYKLIPLLIETVKEQEIRICDLEKRINNG